MQSTDDAGNSSQVRPRELALLHAWMGRFTGAPGAESPRHSAGVPFSFMCGTRSSQDWLKLENVSRESGAWHDGKRLHPCFLGDYYPLTPCSIDPAAWLAYQLLVPGTQEGAVLAFRRSESPMAAATFQLQGLQAEATYDFEDADSGQHWQATGRDLLTTGLALVAPAPRTSRLLFFRKV